ncbi:hypothetical protein KIPB_010086, partial [Kipferlia bialata]
ALRNPHKMEVDLTLEEIVAKNKQAKGAGGRRASGGGRGRGRGPRRESGRQDQRDMDRPRSARGGNRDTRDTRDNRPTSSKGGDRKKLSVSVGPCVELANLHHAIGDKVTLENVHTKMRTWPVRDCYTQWLATSASSTSVLASLQKCHNIFDGFNAETSDVVACADPAPPTSWAILITSWVLMGLILGAWYYGLQQAKAWDAQHAM